MYQELNILIPLHYIQIMYYPIIKKTAIVYIITIVNLIKNIDGIGYKNEIKIYILKNLLWMEKYDIIHNSFPKYGLA